LTATVGCDCAEALATALGGIVLRGSDDALASSCEECAWCGAGRAAAQPDIVISLANLAWRN
jgi:hypothetical protein